MQGNEPNGATHIRQGMQNTRKQDGSEKRGIARVWVLIPIVSVEANLNQMRNGL